MDKITSFLCVLFLSAFSHAREILININQSNCEKFDIRCDDVAFLQIQRRKIYLSHDIAENTFDLKVYEDQNFDEARIDMTGGGGDK